MDCRTALLTVLDQVDYTNGACGLTEMVGAVLQKEVIALARKAIAEEDEKNLRKQHKPMESLTKEQARQLIDAYEILQVLGNEEEIECLKENNPEFLECLFALRRIGCGENI